MSRAIKAVCMRHLKARGKRRVFQAKKRVKQGHGWWKGCRRQCEMRLEKSAGNGSGRVFKAAGGLLSLFQEQVESREGPVVW